ncbi:MAG TPA: PEGA domain-containing protein [Haliangium sp.]|nr:PEGA domain-containing protein [Haliangium sp.]
MSRRRGAPRALACLVAASLLLGAAGAGAQQPDPEQQADQPDAAGQANAGQADDKQRRAEAERLFRAGEQAYHAGQYELAAQAFEASYRLLPAPQIAFSMGQAYRLQYFVDKDEKVLARAVELFRLYLDKVPRGGRREVAITHLAELEPLLVRAGEERAQDERAPGPAPEPGDRPSRLAEIMVTSPVDGAEGAIADTEGPLPLKVEVEPGRYQATVTAPGYASGSKTVDVVAGRFFVVEVPLQPIPARVALRATPGATVLIDGRASAETPLGQPVEVTAGNHVLSVRKRGHRLWRKPIEVERGDQLDLEVELRRTTRRKMSYAVMGFGGVVLGGAVLTGLQALDQDSKARALESRYDQDGLTSRELEQYEDHRRKRDTAALVTYSLLGAAAVTAAGGFVLYWFDMPAVERVQPEQPAPARPRITPMLAPDGMGMSVSGRF